jgi:hypothetical protein
MRLEMKIRFLSALLISFFSLPLVSASAAESEGIVVLTWERGVEQSVTIGGSTDGSLWNIELRSLNGKALAFTRSTKNSSGFYLYTLQIPDDFPKGRYEVYATTLNRPEQLTSYVEIVERKSFDPLSDVKKLGYLGTVAFAIFTVIATARKEDFETVAIRRTRENDEAGDDRNDPLSVNYKDNLVELDKRGIVDRIGYGRINWIAKLDAIRFSFSHKLPRVSPLAGRYVSDASWFQAVFGPLVLFLPLAGIVTGLALAADTDMSRTLVPSSLVLVLLGIIIGILDAFSGLLVAGTYVFWALVSGNLVNAIDLRTLLAISIIFSAPLLLVGNIRPLRREPESWSFTERFIDVVVVGVLSVVITRALFVSLDNLSQQETVLASYASYFSLIAGAAIVIRYLIEDIAERIAPARLNYLIPTSIPAQEFSYYVGAVLIKVSTFLLFLIGFFGISWQLLVGLAILLAVEVMKYFKDYFPNSPFLFQLLPSGIPLMVAMAFVGVVTTSWAESLPLVAEDRAQTIFIILSIPSLLITFVKFFGRNPRLGDVKWYCRRKLRPVYYLFGPAMVALALGLQLGVI